MAEGFVRRLPNAKHSLDDFPELAKVNVLSCQTGRATQEQERPRRRLVKHVISACDITPPDGGRATSHSDCLGGDPIASFQPQPGAPATHTRTAEDVQPVGSGGPGGCVAVPCSGQGAARGDLLPRVDLRGASDG